MSGPIVRTGATPEFWNNWDNVFGKKAKGRAAAAEKEPASKKKAAAKPPRSSAKKIARKPKKKSR